MRRLGEQPNPNHRYITRPGAYGLILSGDQALLTLSFEEEAAPQLPGGVLIPERTPYRPCIGKFWRKTGYKIAVERRIGAFQRFCFLPEYGFWAQKICAIYLCRAVYRLGEASEPYHCAMWAPLETVPGLMIDPAQAEFVADYLGM